MIKAVPGVAFYAILGCIMVIVAISSCFLRKPHNENLEQEEEHKKGALQSLVDTVKVSFSRKMAFILPMLIYSGVSIAFWSGMLSPICVKQIKQDERHKDIWENDNAQLSMALFAMSAFGLGEVVSGPMQGKIIDKYGYKTGIVSIIVIIFLGGGMTIQNCIAKTYGFHSYVMTFLWGMTDGVVNIQIFTTLS